MSAPSKWAPRACRLCRASPAFRRAFASATTNPSPTDTKTPLPPAAWPQRQPRGEYYDILLRDPTPYGVSAASKSPSPPTPSEAPPPSRPAAKTYETISSRTAYSNSNTKNTSTAEERARVIFGSRLLGPAERADRAAGRQARSTTVAGVRVPPRPEEPDNCCMSGCVNCVWDLFREEMEEWTLKSNEAKKRLAESAAAAVPRGGNAGTGGGGSGLEVPSSSVDAAGGEANRPVLVGDAKIAKDMWTDDVFQNVPVGIREFMKQEKRLKEKHQREGTSGG